MKQNIIHLSIYLFVSILTHCSSCQNRKDIAPLQMPNAPAADSATKLALDADLAVIFKDGQGGLWLSSNDEGLYRYQAGQLHKYTLEDGLGTYRIIAVQEDADGALYFDTPQAVYRYDGEKFAALPIADNADNEWKSEPGDLWFRMGWNQPGPYRFDGEKLYPLTFPKNSQEAAFYSLYPNASFNPYAIYSMYQDREGNLWFGTSNLGVYMFDGTEISWMYENHHIETPSGGNFGVRSIGQDQKGDYWICNARYRYTLLPVDAKTDGLQSIKYNRQVGIESEAVQNIYFYAMEIDLNGDLLMFAKEDGLWRNDGKRLTPFYIIDAGKEISPSSMYKDRDGIFWFGTAHDGIYRYDGEGFERLWLE